ncbi:MAG TPA: DUF6152 family protein [Burkholderiaceae bacterium]|nr:DUF6152 family protein [Burkholderiaceae bacterium]
MRTRFALLLVAAMSLASAVLAHHGWSGYDASKPLTLKGSIKESGYEHPHGHVRLQTSDKLWLAVLAPPYRMENRGLPRELLKPGTEVTVVGYPHRSDPDEMRVERITVGDKTVELR